MAFELPDLPYAHDALAAGGMSKETLEYHHDLHHKAYVDNGNKLIAGTEWENKSLEDIVKGTYAAGDVAQNGIFNNASQHWNHMQFWEMMGPNSGAMPGELEKRINESFGSVDKFKEEFSAAGAGQFGKRGLSSEPQLKAVRVIGAVILTAPLLTLPSSTVTSTYYFQKRAKPRRRGRDSRKHTCTRQGL